MQNIVLLVLLSAEKDVTNKSIKIKQQLAINQFFKLHLKVQILKNLQRSQSQMLTSMHLYNFCFLLWFFKSSMKRMWQTKIISGQVISLPSDAMLTTHDINFEKLPLFYLRACCQLVVVGSIFKAVVILYQEFFSRYFGQLKLLLSIFSKRISDAFKYSKPEPITFQCFLYLETSPMICYGNFIPSWYNNPQLIWYFTSAEKMQEAYSRSLLKKSYDTQESTPNFASNIKDTLNLFKQSEAAAKGVLYKKVFLDILQNSQENPCARVSF